MQHSTEQRPSTGRPRGLYQHASTTLAAGAKIADMTQSTTPPPLVFPFNPAPGVSRMITVRVPDENALAVWVATGERFQSMGDEWDAAQQALADRPDDDPDLVEFKKVKAQQATRALGRALRVINAALVKESDRDWVEECLLEQKFKLGDALGIITGAVEELKRRQAEEAPQPPVTKKPATKARRV